jgi:hypothetical protein
MRYSLVGGLRLAISRALGTALGRKGLFALTIERRLSRGLLSFLTGRVGCCPLVATFSRSTLRKDCRPVSLVVAWNPAATVCQVRYEGGLDRNRASAGL